MFFSNQKSCIYNCLKEKCPLWVVLTNTYTLENGESKKELEGKCTFAWIPQLLVELKQEKNK
jgi:hypothetical protein